MYPGKWAAMNPDKPALIMADTEEMITYAQLEERSLRLANYMRSIGFKKGDHLAVMAENRIASASARSPPAQPLKRSPDGRTTNRCSPRHPRRSPNTNLVATTCSTHRERPGDPGHHAGPARYPHRIRERASHPALHSGLRLRRGLRLPLAGTAVPCGTAALRHGDPVPGRDGRGDAEVRARVLAAAH
jgi:hypothetical protein